MNAADIRDLFREFFVARGHLAGEPAGLVPAGDPSVLFTTAGMQQYKPYFLGVGYTAVQTHHHLSAFVPHLGHRERGQDRPASHLL